MATVDSIRRRACRGRRNTPNAADLSSRTDRDRRSTPNAEARSHRVAAARRRDPTNPRAYRDRRNIPTAADLSAAAVPTSLSAARACRRPIHPAPAAAARLDPRAAVPIDPHVHLSAAVRDRTVRLSPAAVLASRPDAPRRLLPFRVLPRRVLPRVAHRLVHPSSRLAAIHRVSRRRLASSPVSRSRSRSPSRSPSPPPPTAPTRRPRDSDRGSASPSSTNLPPRWTSRALGARAAASNRSVVASVRSPTTSTLRARDGARATVRARGSRASRRWFVARRTGASAVARDDEWRGARWGVGRSVVGATGG